MEFSPEIGGKREKLKNVVQLKTNFGTLYQSQKQTQQRLMVTVYFY
jgi:hypothetical protein